MIIQIVQFPDGRYAVRKLTLFGWEYRDKDDNFWWESSLALKRWITVDTLEEARNLKNKNYTPKVIE